MRLSRHRHWEVVKALLISVILLHWPLIAQAQTALDTESGNDASAGVAPTKTTPAGGLAVIPVEPALPDNKADESQVRRSNVLIDEVVVTAQKREENLQDVPISIQAFSAEAMSAKGVLDAGDLPTITPSLTVTTQINYTSTFIRGVGSDAFVSSDPSVAMYIDGVYQPISLNLVQDFGAVERVEILKGPQGTLFGRNAIGGAINTISKMPSLAGTEAEVQTSYGTYNNFKNRVYLSEPFSDTFAMSLSGIYNVSDSAKNGRINGRGLGQDKGKGARLKARWLPWDWIEFSVAGLVTTTEGAGAVYAPNTDPSPLFSAVIQPQNPRAGQSNEDLFAHSNNKEVYGTLLLKTDAMDIKLSASNQNIHISQNVDFDGSNVPVALFQVAVLGDIQSAELQFLSNKTSWNADWLTWIGGIYYFKSHQGFAHDFLRAAATSLTGGVVLGVPIPDALLDPLLDLTADLPIPNGQVDFVGLLNTDSIAGYTQMTADITDWASLTVGARYSHEKRELDESSSGLGTTGGGTIPIQHYQGQTDTTKSFDPKVSLAFHTGDQTLMYLTWQRATKASTYNVLNIYDPPEYIEPEKMNAYEVGIKTRFLDNLVTLNAAAFDYRIKHQQVQFISLFSAGLVALENADVRIRGLEADTIVQLFPEITDGLVFTASGAWLHSIYSSFLSGTGFDPTTGLTTSNNDFSGNDVVRSPTLSGNGGLLQTLPLGPGSIDIAVDYYYNSGFYYGAQNRKSDEQKAYGLLGSHISYLYEPWNLRVTVFGKNLTGETYYFGRFQNDFGTDDFIAPKQEYGVRINWTF